uniref:Brix domain-containing protein n=1 Tax=Panagrellus redivivus TaxID=6233 RepID=A0A7E4UYR3_PANRE
MAHRKKSRKGIAARNAKRGQAGLPLITRGSGEKRSRIEAKREKEKAEKIADGNLKHNVDIALQEEAIAKQPHSFVVHTGSVGRYVRRLEKDLREVMEPNTASKLKVTKSNNFKDYIVNAPVLGVTHILNFTKSEKSVNLRIIRVPQGPTLCFAVDEYSLARDIRATQKRVTIFQKLFQQSPLVVLNGFSVPGAKHLALVKTVIQNMFPSIDIDTVKLANVRRAVLISYNAETEQIEFRHYSVKTVPAGIAKSAKKIVQGKIPDLSKYEDISEFFLNPGALSDSEWEGEQAEVDLAQDLATRGCAKGTKTKLRMVEIGPRMTWRLTKILEGVDDGEVLYHSYIKKTQAELNELRKKLPMLKKRKKRIEKDVEHAAIRQLQHAEDQRKAEEEEFEEYKEKLIRRQKAVTGDAGDSEDEKLRRQAVKPGSTSQKNQEDGPPPAEKASKPKTKRTASKSSGEPPAKRKPGRI